MTPTLALRRTPLALLALLGALAWVGGGPATPAHAEARVTVVNERGENAADLTYSTEVTVSGSGFQAVQGAFGGIYVVFGTVGPGWRPSSGGTSGVDLRYVPDSQSQSNAGFQRYVAFPGSSTAGEAHATMSGTGSWSVTLTVPGPTFQTVGAGGATETVDCTRVTCGVITFGAHGVTNANNETFTPVAFTDLGPGAGGGEDVDAPSPEGAEDATDEEAAADDAGPEAPVEPRLEVDATTAVVGRVLTFTAQGFVPGEQVIGVLGAGLAAVGPLVAGAHGELAGALQVPSDLRAGTHALALTGAASGVRVEDRIQVAAAPAAPPAPAAPSAAGPEPWWSDRQWLALGLAALALVVVIAVGVVTGARERAARRVTR